MSTHLPINQPHKLYLYRYSLCIYLQDVGVVLEVLAGQQKGADGEVLDHTLGFLREAKRERESRQVDD